MTSNKPVIWKRPVSDQVGDLVAGGYVSKIPACPALEYDGYSRTYQRRANPEQCTFRCEFPHWSYIKPPYNEDQGLLDHP